MFEYSTLASCNWFTYNVQRTSGVYHNNNIDTYMDAVIGYIGKCIADVVPRINVRTFTNQKPWFNMEVHAKLKVQLMPQVIGGLQKVQRTISSAKSQYRDKVDPELPDGQTPACADRHHILPPDSQHQCPSGLRAQPSLVLPPTGPTPSSSLLTTWPSSALSPAMMRQPTERRSEP